MTGVVRVFISCTLLIAGIFVAPYLLPPSSAATSASTMIGFNNALAYVLYLIAASMSAWILSRPVSWKGPALVLPASDGSFWPTASVWWIGLVHAVGFLLLYSYKKQFVFADGLYFQHVAHRVASGGIPYSTVGFMYGPATLYPVVFLSKFMSVTDAYAIYYVAVYLAGLYALFAMLRWCVAKQERADRIFIALAVGFFNPIAALNYTFVRHLLPALTVLTAWGYFAKGGWGRFVLGAGMLWMSLMYSPDMGIVAAAGVAVLVLVQYGSNLWMKFRYPSEARSTTSRRLGILEMLLLPGLAFSMMLIVFAMIPPGIVNLGHYAEVVSRFSAGGSNTPVEASIPLLALLVLLVLILTGTIALLSKHGLRGAAVPLVALCVTCAMMQRAAFGKPDGVHIAYAALPALIVCFAVLPGILGSRKARTGLTIALLSFALPLQYYHALLFLPFFASRIAAKRQAKEQSAAVKQPIAVQLDELVQAVGTGRAYYMHNLMYYSLPIIMKQHLRQALYATIPEEVFTDREVLASIAQLAGSGAAVIIPRDDLKPDAGRIPSLSSNFVTVIDSLTASPLQGSRVYRVTWMAQHALWQPFVDYVQACYEVRGQTRDLVGFVPPAAGLSAHCARTAVAHAL